jgi:hypothetical protein
VFHLLFIYRDIDVFEMKDFVDVYVGQKVFHDAVISKSYKLTK